jgi:hypothetical protein
MDSPIVYFSILYDTPLLDGMRTNLGRGFEAENGVRRAHTKGCTNIIAFDKPLLGTSGRGAQRWVKQRIELSGMGQKAQQRI